MMTACLMGKKNSRKYGNHLASDLAVNVATLQSFAARRDSLTGS
jgi:hypothetical protein